MKSFAIILIVVVLAAVLFLKHAANSFRLLLHKIDNLSIKNKRLSGVVTLQILNDNLPTFDIKDVDLQLYLNSEFIAPITSYSNLTNGFIQLNIDVDLSKIFTINHLLELMINESFLKIKGNINVSKGFIKSAISVNEKIII